MLGLRLLLIIEAKQKNPLRLTVFTHGSWAWDGPNTDRRPTEGMYEAEPDFLTVRLRFTGFLEKF